VEGFPADAGLFRKIGISIPYLILPTICYTYSSLVFITRTVRSSMSQTLQQDFIRTARAKGLPKKTVLWKHAFRNALLPVITIFSGVFPYLLGGSVIMESVFSIPGMGITIFQGIASQDYPVIMAVFLVTGIMTMCGFLLCDFLYAWADPRISFAKTSRG